MNLYPNTECCRMCGSPGAVLHFPGGYLCPGGCKTETVEAALSALSTPPKDPIDSIQGELDVCRAQSLQMQQEMEELRGIIEQCLSTGAIRVDEHKQLFLDANRVLGRTPQ